MIECHGLVRIIMCIIRTYLYAFQKNYTICKISCLKKKGKKLFHRFCDADNFLGKHVGNVKLNLNHRKIRMLASKQVSYVGVLSNIQNISIFSRVRVLLLIQQRICSGTYECILRYKPLLFYSEANHISILQLGPNLFFYSVLDVSPHWILPPHWNLFYIKNYYFVLICYISTNFLTF